MGLLVRSPGAGICWKCRASGCCSIVECFRGAEKKRSGETATWGLSRNPLAPSCSRTPISTIRAPSRSCRGMASPGKSTSPEHRPTSQASCSKIQLACKKTTVGMSTNRSAGTGRSAFGHFTTGTTCGRSSEGLKESGMAISLRSRLGSPHRFMMPAIS